MSPATTVAPRWSGRQAFLTLATLSALGGADRGRLRRGLVRQGFAGSGAPIALVRAGRFVGERHLDQTGFEGRPEIRGKEVGAVSEPQGACNSARPISPVRAATTLAAGSVS